MSAIEHVRKLGLGMLLAALSNVMLAAATALYELRHVRSLEALKLVGPLTLIALIVYAYGILLAVRSSDALERFVYDLQGLSTGFRALLYALALSFVVIAVALIGVVLFSKLIFASAIILMLLSLLIILVGLVLVGLRLKKLREIFVDPGSRPAIILLGAFLSLLYPPLGNFLVFLGFLGGGYRLYSIRPYPPKILSEIASALAEEVEKNNIVNLLEFASSRGYPIYAVFDAAFSVASERGYSIIRGMLAKSAIRVFHTRTPPEPSRGPRTASADGYIRTARPSRIAGTPRGAP